VTRHDEPIHVIEDDPAEEARQDALAAAIREHGDPQGGPMEEGGLESAGGSAATMVAEARKHLGYRETGNNDTKFNRWLGRIAGYPHGGFGYPWCSSFLAYCLAHSQNSAAGPRTALCSAGVAWFRSRRRFRSVPKVGDFVYYGPGGKTHVELVAAVKRRSITTIGGNTGGSIGGAYFNGDGVYERTVARSSPAIHGFGRPTYAAVGRPARPSPAPRRKSGPPLTSIRSVRKQQQAVNGLGYAPKLKVDGEWDPKTEAGVKWLQRKVGAAPVDAEWGTTTEARYVAHRSG
jgi:CHAP domain